MERPRDFCGAAARIVSRLRHVVSRVRTAVHRGHLARRQACRLTLVITYSSIMPRRDASELIARRAGTR